MTFNLSSNLVYTTNRAGLATEIVCRHFVFVLYDSGITIPFCRSSYNTVLEACKILSVGLVASLVLAHSDLLEIFSRQLSHTLLTLCFKVRL